MDEVRRAERRDRPELAGSRYVWLKRPERLSDRQTETLAWLTRPSSRLATARAYRWRWDFEGSCDQPPELAKAYLAPGAAARVAPGWSPFQHDLTAGLACPICSQDGTLQAETTSEADLIDGGPSWFNGVPTLVCDRCGVELFDEGTTRKLEAFYRHAADDGARTLVIDLVRLETHARI